MTSYIECVDCKAIIKGQNLNHAKALMIEHRRSKKHKEAMKIRSSNAVVVLSGSAIKEDKKK